MEEDWSWMQYEARRLAKFRYHLNACDHKYLPRGFPHDGNNASSDCDNIIFGCSSNWPSRWETTSSFFATAPLKAPRLQALGDNLELRPEHELGCPQLLGSVKTIPRVRRTRQVPWSAAEFSTPLHVRLADEARSTPQYEKARLGITVEQKEAAVQVPPRSAPPPGSARSCPSPRLGHVAQGRKNYCKTPSVSKAAKLRQCMNTPSGASTPIREMRSLKAGPRNSIELWTLSSPRTGVSPAPSVPPVCIVEQ